MNENKIIFKEFSNSEICGSDIVNIKFISNELSYKTEFFDYDFNMGFRIKFHDCNNKYRVLILDNGDIASFEDGNYIGITGDVPTGEVLIDGKAFKDVSDVVMRDRELLAKDGVLMICANINPKTKAVVAGPEIVAKGFAYINENEELKNEILDIFKKVSIKFLVNKFINWSEYKNTLKTELSHAIFKKSKRSPIIIPVLISTDLDEARKATI